MGILPRTVDKQIIPTMTQHQIKTPRIITPDGQMVRQKKEKDKKKTKTRGPVPQEHRQEVNRVIGHQGCMARGRCRKGRTVKQNRSKRPSLYNESENDDKLNTIKTRG